MNQSAPMRRIDYKTAVDFLLPRHYSGRAPCVSYAYGWYRNDELKAVCTFGKPASPKPCEGVCGKEWANHVIELNRLCRTDDLEEPLSRFVSWCLRQLSEYDIIVISYSDTAMNHHGYIYQACNFIYTGATKERTDKYVPDGKHPRHYSNDEQGEYRRVRTSKHRYVYFCTHKKYLKKQWQQVLKWKTEPYPKGDNNNNYKLGYVLKDKLIKVEKS